MGSGSENRQPVTYRVRKKTKKAGPGYEFLTRFSPVQSPNWVMGFCNPLLKPGLLNGSFFLSNFKLGVKKEKKIIFSRPIINLCDLFKLVKYFFENSAQVSLIASIAFSSTFGLEKSSDKSLIQVRMEERTEKWGSFA